MADTAVLPDLDADTDTRTRRQPPYAVVLLNDDDHSFQYVIAVLHAVFRYQVEKCVQLAKEVHTRGRAVVWVGALETAELKREQLQTAGPDPLNPKADYPLGVDLEPQ